jgi:AcrR family transcriptional regulator
LHADVPTVTEQLESHSTQQKLILAAERLFAVHGVHGVSLRQIGAEAGSGNSSAVQYHFGTKEELVQAVLLYRLPRLNERRELLSAMASSTGLRAVMEAHLLPIVEHSELADSYYLTFVEHVLCFSTRTDPFDTLPVEYLEPRNTFIAHARALLVEIPEQIATRRIIDAISMCLHTSAARERARREGSPVMSLRSQTALLLDGLVGYVTAPVSEAALRALESEAAAVVPERVRG